MARTKKTRKIRNRPTWVSKIHRAQRRKLVIWVIFFTSLIGVTVGALFAYHATIGAPRFIIQKVTIDPVSLSYLGDISLYKAISDELQGKNYLLTKRFGHSKMVSDLQLLHPLLKDIEISKNGDKSVFVTVVFTKPNLLFQTPTTYFISYDEHTYQISADSVFLQELFPIQLPQFTSGRTDINGLFRKISEKELKANIDLILSTLGPANISELIYQPGGQRLFLTYKKKRIYLNLSKDLNTQLEKLLALENNRTEFPGLQVVDPGSREETIVK